MGTSECNELERTSEREQPRPRRRFRRVGVRVQSCAAHHAVSLRVVSLRSLDVSHVDRDVFERVSTRGDARADAVAARRLAVEIPESIHELSSGFVYPTDPDAERHGQRHVREPGADDAGGAVSTAAASADLHARFRAVVRVERLLAEREKRGFRFSAALLLLLRDFVDARNAHAHGVFPEIDLVLPQVLVHL
eukprot:12675-Pelagococcus_subviridis.AAC.1